MLNRRTILAASVLAAPAAIPFAQAKRPEREVTLPSSAAAPDPISRHILSQRITKLDHGAVRVEDIPEAFDRNFPQLIEQNFAERDAAGVATLLDSLSDVELADLAQLYVNATLLKGRPEKLMFVLAHRLDARRLSRVSRHFGFERTHHAVYSMAPGKMDGFLSRADTNAFGPEPGAVNYGPNRLRSPGVISEDGMRKMVYRGSGWRMTKVARYTEFLHHTPTEIYQAMRTAKYGSLSVEGALLEAATIMSGAFGRAAVAGGAFGTYVVLPVVQAYYPNFYIGIGDWIGPTVDKMIDAWNFPNNQQKKKDADQTGATNFRVPGHVVSQMGCSGGDWFAVTGLGCAGGGGACYLSCSPWDLL